MVFQKRVEANQLDSTQRDIERMDDEAGGPRFSREAVTDTAAFKKFFDGSKVVDRDGQPMVMAHGTGRLFSQFRMDSELGAHFGPAEQANAITGYASDNDSAYSGRTYPVYLSIKNPLRLEDHGNWGADDVGQQLFAKKIITQDQMLQLKPRWNESGQKINSELRALIRKAGYDGVVYLNRRESSGAKEGDGVTGSTRMSDKQFLAKYPAAQDSWIAFRPTQIKSATGNNGQFDGKNPDIRFSQDEPVGVESGNGPLRQDDQAKTDIGVIERSLARHFQIPGIPSGTFGPVRLPDDSALQRIAGAFGKRALGVRIDPSKLGDRPQVLVDDLTGWNGINIPGRQFVGLREGARRPHLALLGHELAHGLENDDPELYAELVEAIRPYIKQSEYQRMFTRDYPGMTAKGIRAEFIGEVFSDGFMNPKFWDSIGRNSPALLRKVIDAVRLLMERAAKALGYTNKTAKYLTDFDTVMGIAARAMARYEGNQRARAGDTSPQFSGKLAPTFYSELESKLSQVGMKAGPAKAWKDYIKSQIGKGVKADEIEAVGINEWLDLQQGKVTKEQVMSYLAQNGVKVDEVMLGKRTRIESDKERLENMSEDEFRTQVEETLGFDTSEMDLSLDSMDRDDLIESILRENRMAGESRGLVSDEPDTKFAQYALPGAKGGSYRELLLTLPRTPYDRAAATAETNRIAGEYEVRINNVVEAGNIGEYEGGRGAALREADRLRAEREAVLAPLRAQQPADSNFQSTHFDQPNILAHIRFNERTDADGKKVLFLEEVQSDWAQKGRKQGFALTAVEREEMMRLNERTRTTDEVSRLEALVKRDSGVPAAPFVQKTDAWTALVLKRMIRYAAENGFDSVAWTTGEQQVKRYESALRKRVDQIEWTKTPQGIHLVGYKGKKPALTNQQTERLAVLEARNQNTLTGHEIDEIVRMRGVYGYTKVVDTTQKEDALSDAIGKVMADRIIADPNQSGTIEGKNITIDKTGMAGYYGKIMPAVANGILKRLGGGKVGEVGITNGLDGVDPNTGEKLGRKGEMLQPGFQITPEMRDKVMAGQPLFSRAAKGMTAAFREWFGNSKVVDANGEPKVMYHGSTVHHDGNKRGFPLGVFKEFDRLATRKAFGRESLDQVGSWFSDNPSEDGGAGMYTPSDGVMYPVHLSISNPWVVGFKGLWRIAQNQSGQPVGDKPNAKSVDAIRAWLKNMGYDGIHIKREARDESTEFEKQDVWIALEREQIKSVFNPEAEGGPKFSRNKTMGVNVNQDGDNRYADKIVDGDKTMETRASDSLRPYVGQRVAIVRTGAGPAKAIGEVTIGEPIVVRSQREFAKYAEQHLVPKGSKFDLQPGQAKYLYPLTDAVRYPVEKGVGLGIVSRSVKFSRENVLPKNATVLLANKRLSEQPRDVIDALSAGFRDKTDGSMLWEDMFLNLVQEDVTGQELLEVMSNYEESAPRGSEDLRAAAALYAIGIDGMRGDGFETSFASGAVDLQFSREPGFFFDAKSSPLYKTRTAAQVGVMSTAQANEALQTDATARRILEKGITPQPGDVVGVRLNLNVLKKTGVPVMTIHKGSKGDGYKSNRGLWGGEAITYQPVVTVKDAYLNVHQAAREKIATGADSKSPMASVDGKFSTGHSFDGVEFRFNPKREHLFRDGLGRVLKRADEVTLYGNSVYARGEIEYYGPEDVPARAGDAATAGRLMDPENPDRGAPQFSRGESSSDGAGPSRSLPSQTDPFSPGAKTSEDSTPQFNRAPAIAGSQTTGSVTDSILANAVNFTRDLLHTDHKMGWWARSVGTQQHKALTNAEFAPVYEEGQAFIGDQSKFANESADLAPSLLPRIDGFGDFAKKSATEKEIERVTEATYAGTLFGSGSPLEGRKWTDAELRTGRAEDGQFSIPAFTPLNEREIELYHELMNATAHSLDTMGVSLIHKLAVQHDIGFDRDMALEDVAQVVRDQVEDEITDRSVELEEITDPKYIADMAGNAADEAGDDRAGERAAAKVRRDLEKRAKKLQAEIDELEALKTGVDDIEKKITGLKDHGYFPAQRFGQYAIQILDRNGRQLHFSMYETEREANKAERELRKEFPKDNFERMILPDQQYKMFMGMSMDTFEAFADKITGEDGSPISKDPLMQAFFKAAASERSVMKRHIHRKGTAGFNRDLPRVLANFVVSSARATSSNYHSAQMAKLAGRIRAGDVQDEANKLVKYLLEPKEEAQALRGFLFAQFLGGSIAHGIVNMSQPFLVTGPYLTQFTSVKDAAAKLGAAMTTKQKDLTGRLKDDYERAKKEGIVSPQEIHQLRAEASGMAMGRSLLARKFGFIWGSIYSITEQFNRSTSFIAAYRIAQEKGMRDPYAFAVETVNQTQFVYNKGNRPNAGRGALGATVMTFKQFSISYLELAKRLYDRKGPDGKADRKAFAMLLLMLLAAAGLEGLPFAEDIEDLIDTIGQWMGYGTNSKKKLRQWATAVLGPDMAQVALKGVSGLPFMPVDISVRMGMANLIPGTAMLKPSEKNKARDVLEILGPAGQLIPTDDTMVGKALDRLAHSDWYGAVKAGAPVAVQNLAKGAEMLDKGYATDFKGKKIVDVSAGEAVFKMAGLQPASVARESAKIGIIAQDIAIQRKTEADIAERWARGIVDGDPADVQAARQKLADWNKDNPELRIRIQMPQIARRVKEMRMPRDQRFIKSAPPELRPGVRDALR